MAKGFLEVFPTLNIAEPLKELLALTEVEKVTSAKDRSSIRVYMKSARLIHKQNIYDLERGIKDQLFPDKQITIKIQEKYRLSGQYTPEKLLKMYKDSLLLELKHYSIVEYSMFRKAQIVFENEGKMVLTVEDTMVNRDKTNELKRVLEKVFNERCGLPVEVSFLYIPAKENDRRKQIEQKLEREAQAIYWQNHKDELGSVNSGENIPQPAAIRNTDEKKTQTEDAIIMDVPTPEAAPWDALMDQAASGSVPGNDENISLAAIGTKPTDVEKTAASKILAGERTEKLQLNKGRKGWGREKDSSFGEDRKFSVKRSNNPDVLYGRDFDDDFMEIEKIDGEIGEVTLRGQILTCESRELRSGKFILTFDITDFTDAITAKMFIRPEIFNEVKDMIKTGMFIKIKGVTTIDKFDGELTLGSIAGIKKAEDFTTKRMWSCTAIQK